MLYLSLNGTKIFKSEFEITIKDSLNADINGWTFKIADADELQYARHLCMLNRLYVQPFIQRNKQLLDSVSSNFARYYAIITSRDNEFRYGKTVHRPIQAEKLRNICVHVECGRRNSMVWPVHGHLSHFRGTFQFVKGVKFSIRQLIFDFNYFNCYMKPILNTNSSDFF